MGVATVDAAAAGALVIVMSLIGDGRYYMKVVMAMLRLGFIACME